MAAANFWPRVQNRLALMNQNVNDLVHLAPIRLFNQWPCHDRKLLLVGSESSGSTAIANLLFSGLPSCRFLEEGDNKWVWPAYQAIYQGKAKVSDYPRLQLFGAIKVPGFATILPEFVEAFPDTKIIYIVRDPRDMVNSAIKTWRLNSVAELKNVSWSAETWLGLNDADPVIRVAKRWRTYLRCAEDAKNVSFVRYEDFCADKMATIERLTNVMGIPFNRQHVESVQNRQLSHPSVRGYAPVGPGGWQTGLLSSEDISKIEKACHDEMTRWNYEPATTLKEFE